MKAVSVAALKSGITAIRTRPDVVPRFSTADQHQRRSTALQLAAASQPRLRTADPRVIDFHVAVQRLAGRVDHRAPQLVQQHPRRFVPSQAQLPLEQERRHAALVGHRQIGRPEPHRQRRLRVVENRAGRQRDLVSARRALPSSMRRSCDRPARARIADRRTRPASDTPPNSPDRLPRSRIDAGTRAYSSETAAAARRYTTYGGVLKQPDKQKQLAFGGS